MPSVADYRILRDRDWCFHVLSEQWSGGFKEDVLALVNRQMAAKHPQSIQLRWPEGDSGHLYFVKIFHGFAGLPLFKDWFRESKAMCFWRQGVALSQAGFNVPLTVAVGERRRWGRLERAFVVTQFVDGEAVPNYLRNRDSLGADKTFLARKRAGIRHLGLMVRRFHALGFIHGDLVASNVFVSEQRSGDVEFYLMDNDRTRHYPSWSMSILRRRNLIQLNRMPLPNISLEDRMRFLHAYLDEKRLSQASRKLAKWLEQKTRQRRKEVDGADTTISFRALMRCHSKPLTME
jgi:hypothetical protein